jgi:hypothetical protein
MNVFKHTLTLEKLGLSGIEISLQQRSPLIRTQTHTGRLLNAGCPLYTFIG